MDMLELMLEPCYGVSVGSLPKVLLMLDDVSDVLFELYSLFQYLRYHSRGEGQQHDITMRSDQRKCRNMRLNAISSVEKRV